MASVLGDSGTPGDARPTDQPGTIRESSSVRGLRPFALHPQHEEEPVFMLLEPALD